jgi:hypothetical protein
MSKYSLQIQTQPMLIGVLDDGHKAVKWATDYFIKAHTSTNEFYGQVGKGDVDHDFWGRPEDMTMPRPAYKIDTSRPGKLHQVLSVSNLSLSYLQENQQPVQNVFVILSSETFTDTVIPGSVFSTYLF